MTDLTESSTHKGCPACLLPALSPAAVMLHGKDLAGICMHRRALAGMDMVNDGQVGLSMCTDMAMPWPMRATFLHNDTHGSQSGLGGGMVGRRG